MRKHYSHFFVIPCKRYKSENYHPFAIVIATILTMFEGELK